MWKCKGRPQSPLRSGGSASAESGLFESQKSEIGIRILKHWNVCPVENPIRNAIPALKRNLLQKRRVNLLNFLDRTTG